VNEHSAQETRNVNKSLEESPQCEESGFGTPTRDVYGELRSPLEKRACHVLAKTSFRDDPARGRERGADSAGIGSVDAKSSDAKPDSVPFLWPLLHLRSLPQSSAGAELLQCAI
jgi:hypothetical protein